MGVLCMHQINKHTNDAIIHQCQRDDAIIHQCRRDKEVWVTMTSVGGGRNGSDDDDGTRQRQCLSRQDGVAVRAGTMDELTGF